VPQSGGGAGGGASPGGARAGGARGAGTGRAPSQSADALSTGGSGGDETTATDDPLGAGPDEEYDPSGTDLARQIARAVATAQRGRARRRKMDRPEPTLSGARPDDRDPSLLGNAVERLMADRGWSRTVDVHTLLARWALLVGPTNAEHSRPEGYDDGVVVVRADSTAWATQLRGLAPQIVAQLNEKLGDGAVTRIDVRGPNAPSWKHGRLSVPGSRGPRDTYG